MRTRQKSPLGTYMLPKSCIPKGSRSKADDAQMVKVRRTDPDYEMISSLGDWGRLSNGKEQRQTRIRGAENRTRKRRLKITRIDCD